MTNVTLFLSSCKREPDGDVVLPILETRNDILLQFYIQKGKEDIFL